MPSVFLYWFLFPSLRWLGITRTAVLITFLLSMAVASVPDGYAEKYVVAQTGWTERAPLQCNVVPGNRGEGRKVFAPTGWLFERKVLDKTLEEAARDHAKELASGKIKISDPKYKPPDTQLTPFHCQIAIWLGGSRNLDVADIDFVKNKQIVKAETTINLRGRNLQYADFSRSDLKQADFHGAKLRGAKFEQSDLKAVKFRIAQAHGADLGSARLQGANLRGARVWLTGPPGGKALLATFPKMVIRPLFVKEKNTLKAEINALAQMAKSMAANKTPGHQPVASALRRFEKAAKPLLAPHNTGEWADRKTWQDWANSDKNPPPETDKLACYLAAELACNDDTDKAWVSWGLILGRIAPFLGPKIAPSVFYNRFKNCPAAKKVPTGLMAQLKKAADEDAAKQAANDKADSKPKQCAWK